MIVDVHTHFWQEGFLPDAFHEESAREWAAQKEGRKPEMVLKKLAEGFIDPDGEMYIENMNRAGVDVAIIHTLDVGQYWCGEEPEVSLEKQFLIYRKLQDTFKGRLYAFAYADPRRPDCVRLMKKAVDDYGFVGCGEFVPLGFNINDEIAQPLFRFCMERSLPVAIHTRPGTGIDIWSLDLTKNNPCHPAHIASLMERYPELTVFISHVGWPVWWETACNIAREIPNCYLELSDWNLEMTSPDQFIPKLCCMKDFVGAERILFASDQTSGPYRCIENPYLKSWVDFFKNMPEQAGKMGYDISQSDIDLILGGNAARIFNTKLHSNRYLPGY